MAATATTHGVIAALMMPRRLARASMIASRIMLQPL
jgi:hypothetical protein